MQARISQLQFAVYLVSIHDRGGEWRLAPHTHIGPAFQVSWAVVDGSKPCLELTGGLSSERALSAVVVRAKQTFVSSKMVVIDADSGPAPHRVPAALLRNVLGPASTLRVQILACLRSVTNHPIGIGCYFRQK